MVELLRTLVGARLTRLVRYSWWPKEAVSNECSIAPVAAFSLTAGPLALAFEDRYTLGVASDPSQNSVIVWMDRDAEGPARKSPAMDEDPEIYPIQASEREFAEAHWATLLNASLSGVSILRARPSNVLKSQLPNEVGMLLHFGEHGDLLAGHGLHDGSDDFAVLRSDQVESEVWQQLEKVPLF